MNDDPHARIEAALHGLGLSTTRPGPRHWTVGVPTTLRGELACGLEARERTLVARAFVLRAPDRAHDRVYRAALERNIDCRTWYFALDRLGDIFLVAELSLDRVDEDALDGLLGALSVLVDETFEGLARTGFDVPEGAAFGPPPGGAANPRD
ncbi:MAG: YbjN domain-containing protein [Miltoncostaeaceae bacterium]